MKVVMGAGALSKGNKDGQLPAGSVNFILRETSPLLCLHS